MRIGQIVTIRVTNTKGVITLVDDFTVDIDWLKKDGSSRHGEAVRYDLPHIESLIHQETLRINDELPEGDPNLSFKARESE